MSIEAMKQALKALDRVHSALPVRDIKVVGKAITALRIAIEEAEKQEPMLSIDRLDQWLDASLRKKLAQHTQPEWVGLTDEEIEQGHKESWVDKQAFESAVWWAEAKLKEKNT